MLKYFSIASSSSGNCHFLTDGVTNILIDAGVSARKITAALAANELRLGDILYVLVTHSHQDHVHSVAALYEKYGVKVITNKLTAAELMKDLPKKAIKGVYTPGAAFAIGNIRINTFPLSHDAPCCNGFRFTGRTGESLAFATDLGFADMAVVDALAGAGLVVLESNYDEDMLQTGPYPQTLKRRICSATGHLCNLDCANTLKELSSRGTRYFALAHLSDHNNTPETALAAAEKALEGTGCSVKALPKDGAGPVYILEKTEIWSA